MSYHILSINSPNCTITCSKGQLIYIDSSQQKKTIPLEDVASIVIASFNAQLTSSFLISAASHKISVILCEAHKPAAILLPADRASDTELLIKLSQLSSNFKANLWTKTVQAKCLNQLNLAIQWDASHPLIDQFKTIASRPNNNKEALCAKMFWNVFAHHHDSTFTRNQDEDGINSLLNYGYAVLLSSVLQKLFALGIDPTFGIFHRPREHATPLAYDLMEPFRPIIDANVSRWIFAQENQSPLQINEQFKRHIVASLQASIIYDYKSLTLQEAIEQVCRSFRQAVIHQSLLKYKPWKTSTIKWAGSL